jgi:protein involved in sex pheromone biosynthesis
MKKWLPLLVTVILLTAGCTPKFGSEDKVVQEKNNKKETAIIPNYQISNNYYRTILPYKPSKNRGLTVNNLNTRYDIQEFETGLLRVAKTTYSPEKYLFQEGQILDADTLKMWLNRKFTQSQWKAVQKQANPPSQNIGLNPALSGKGSIDSQNQNSPIYLANILEHDYLIKTDNNTVKLGGIVIGLAMNSTNYYQSQNGTATQSRISQAVIDSEGKSIAGEVVKRLRAINQLKNVPITIALFEQKDKDSVVPGNYFAYTNISGGSSSIGNWNAIQEKYYLFPSPEADASHPHDAGVFDKFKKRVENYFPNYNGVIGRALYTGNKLTQLKAEIPIQFFGEAEVIGFTQFVSGIVPSIFPDNIDLQIKITSGNDVKALITRSPGQTDTSVHIYQ